MDVLTKTYPIQPYHFQAILSWLDGTFNKNKQKQLLRAVTFILFYALTNLL